MPAFVVLLRAVNVGGANRVGMADLRGVLADAGFGDVTTHIQSGNLVLSQPGTAAALEDAVEGVLNAALGLDVVAIARTATAMRRVAGTAPFPTDADPKSLHVAFLKRRPSAAAARALAAVAYGREEHVLRGTELHLRYPDGVGRARTTGAMLERVLGTPLTMRNRAVVARLAALASGAA